MGTLEALVPDILLGHSPTTSVFTIVNPVVDTPEITFHFFFLWSHGLGGFYSQARQTEVMPYESIT